MICGVCHCKKEKVLTTQTFYYGASQLVIGDIPASICECGIHMSKSIEQEIDLFLKEKPALTTAFEAVSYNCL